MEERYIIFRVYTMNGLFQKVDQTVCGTADAINILPFTFWNGEKDKSALPMLDILQSAATTHTVEGHTVHYFVTRLT